MAWTTPRTWSPGETVTASLMNAHLRDNLNVVKVSISDNGKIQAISSSYFESLSGANLTGIPASAVTGLPGEVQSAQVNASGVAAGTAETDLFSDTLAASKLSATGKYLEILVWLEATGNNGTKTFKFYFGGATVMSFTISASATARAGMVTIRVIKTGSNTQLQLLSVSSEFVGPVIVADVATSAITDTSTIAYKVTGQRVTSDTFIAKTFLASTH